MMSNWSTDEFEEYFKLLEDAVLFASTEMGLQPYQIDVIKSLQHQNNHKSSSVLYNKCHEMLQDNKDRESESPKEKKAKYKNNLHTMMNKGKRWNSR